HPHRRALLGRDRRTAVAAGCGRRSGAARLTDAGGGRYTFGSPGAIAQLGERLDRTQEVGGSSPPSSIPGNRLGYADPATPASTSTDSFTPSTESFVPVVPKSAARISASI